MQLKREWQILLQALMFYTRIPVAKSLPHDEKLLENCTRYFPFIGLIVGGVSFAIYYLLNLLFNDSSIAIVFSIICSVLITGAFHEDGFADVCDGFGGGWTKEKILQIMKDSRVGAYALIGMSLLLLLKFTLLSHLILLQYFYFIVFAHTASRWMPMWLMYFSNYVRENEDAKAKPLAKAMSKKNLLIGFFFVLVSSFVSFNINNLFIVPLVFILPIIGIIYLNYYFNKWIGGYTGDCLGATQQITEILFYINFIILWKYI